MFILTAEPVDPVFPDDDPDPFLVTLPGLFLLPPVPTLFSFDLFVPACSRGGGRSSSASGSPGSSSTSGSGVVAPAVSGSPGSVTSPPTALAPAALAPTPASLSELSEVSSREIVNLYPPLTST